MINLIKEIRKSKIQKELVKSSEALYVLETFHYYAGMCPTQYEIEKKDLEKKISKLKKSLEK